MEIRQLRYFFAVVEHGQFNLAARSLNISQPGLSSGIKRLEDNLGVLLLDRSGQQAVPTEAGQLLLARGGTALDQLDRLEKTLRNTARGEARRVRVGFVNSMLVRGLLDAVASAQAGEPIDLELREMSSQEQVHALSNGKIDIGCMHAVQHPETLISHTLLSEPFVCCMAADHPRAAQASVSLGALRDERFVCFRRDISPYYHDALIGLCTEAGFEPRISHAVMLWQSVVAVVAAGLAVAIVPSSMRDSAADSTVFRPIVGASGRSEVFIVRRRDLDSKPARQVMQLIEKSTAARVGKHAGNDRGTCPKTGSIR